MAVAQKKSSPKETPLMKQYNAIKAKHPGALLLFRVGDFYETFGADAIKAAGILDIVLTKRANGSASEVELAGFPHHALDTYLPKLIRSGERVAICDQLEDPKLVKGIVKRGVTELVTPGLAFSENVLNSKRSNYLASVFIEGEHYGLALLDISTGEFLVSEGNKEFCTRILQGMSPAEVILRKSDIKIFSQLTDSEYNSHGLEDWVYVSDFALEKLTRHFKTNSLKGFGIQEMPFAILAAGAILHYLEETEHHDIDHINSISRMDRDHYVWLDKFTIRNLELARPQQDNGKSLMEVLNQTSTALGSRMMQKWVVMPLQDQARIEARHKVVQALVKDEHTRGETQASLTKISDLERLISKVAVGRVNPRELAQLNRSLLVLPHLKQVMRKAKNEDVQIMADNLDPCEELVTELSRCLGEDLPLHSNQGGIICPGVNAELDELRGIAYSGKDHLIQIREREVKRTGIPSLKLAYNKVFGYYLEVSNTHKEKVPREWIRKQTLVNAERYITSELKGFEEKILNAEEKINVLEYGLFQDLVNKTAEYIESIQATAKTIGHLDCLLSFALIANRYNYVRPRFVDGLSIKIKDGRHPVIERQLPPGEPYIPNDLFMDNDDQQIIIVTGPNMAGKSAILRQTALIVLMAQMGSFVPAKSAEMGIVDKVFTRVGASDNLSAGESTFMVEMTETASILNNLSERSLILMDEIGRGTSTYDGVSIAWAITEYLHNNPGFRPKTLFATHYHELNQLTNDLPRVKNFNVSVKEVGDRVIFLRKLKPGGSEHSFGIHVAQMAGMPNKVVLRAHEIMHFLEKDHRKTNDKKSIQNLPPPTQLALFETDPRLRDLEEFLTSFDINTISPVEALLKLNEVRNMMKMEEEKSKS